MSLFSVSKRELVRFALIAVGTLVFVGALLVIAFFIAFHDPGWRARQAAAKIELEQLWQSVELFNLEVGRYPTALEGLDVLRNNPNAIPKWNGPYTRSQNLKDPWGITYMYVIPATNNRSFEIKSLGADGKEGGEGPNADIVKN